MAFTELELARLDEVFSNLPSVRANSARVKREDEMHRIGYERRTSPQQRMTDEVRAKVDGMEYNLWLGMAKRAGAASEFAEYL